MFEVEFLPGSINDSRAVYRVFHRSIRDLSRRLGLLDQPVETDEAGEEEAWQNWQPLFEHLARTAENFQLAVLDGEVIGYGRSILRDGMRELTELFVLPVRQSAGLGGSLMAQVFPTEGATHRTIIATIDTRALARYLKTGVYARFPITNFSRAPRKVPSLPSPARDLAFGPMTSDALDLEGLRQIDRSLLGYTRDVDHAYWQANRQGFFVYRSNILVGYGYAGLDGGPFALLDGADFPDVLAHAEGLAAQMAERFHLEVPLVNKAAVDYLLSAGYEMNQFMALFMSDTPFGRMENYILHAPPLSL